LELGGVIRVNDMIKKFIVHCVGRVGRWATMYGRGEVKVNQLWTARHARAFGIERGRVVSAAKTADVKLFG
jgi:hypothetical protein